MKIVAGFTDLQEQAVKKGAVTLRTGDTGQGIV